MPLGCQLRDTTFLIYVKGNIATERQTTRPLEIPRFARILPRRHHAKALRLSGESLRAGLRATVIYWPAAALPVTRYASF